MQENQLSKTNRILTCSCGHSFYIDYLYAERNPSRFNTNKPYRMYCTKCNNFVYFDANDGVNDIKVILKQKIRHKNQSFKNEVKDRLKPKKAKSRFEATMTLNVMNDIDMDRSFKEWEQLWAEQMNI